jgi:hypothetical protein
MALALQLIGGAAGGLVLGLFLGGARTCSSGRCRARCGRWLMALAGAVCGFLLALALAGS